MSGAGLTKARLMINLLLYSVKWLGHLAPGVLAIEGKMSKEQTTAAVRRWSDLSGREVTQPGELKIRSSLAMYLAWP